MSVCDICTELLGYEEDVSAVPCGHIFHRTCLEDWTKVNSSCPKCRQEFSSDYVIEKLYFDRLEGCDEEDGVNLNNKIEVLEASLALKENEIRALVKTRQELETALSIKEIEKMDLQEEVDAKTNLLTHVQKELGRIQQTKSKKDNSLKAVLEDLSDDSNLETIGNQAENLELRRQLNVANSTLSCVQNELRLAKEKLDSLSKTQKFTYVNSSLLNNNTQENFAYDHTLMTSSVQGSPRRALSPFPNYLNAAGSTSDSSIAMLMSLPMRDRPPKRLAARENSQHEDASPKKMKVTNNTMTATKSGQSSTGNTTEPVRASSRPVKRARRTRK